MSNRAGSVRRAIVAISSIRRKIAPVQVFQKEH
jgi:hypothetical protein